MNSIRLNDLLQAITSAVTATQQATRDQHHQNLTQHFDTDERSGQLKPKTTPMLLPKAHVEEGEDHEGVHEVPQMALANHDQIHLSELDLEIDCLVQDVARSDDQPSVSLLVGGDAPKKARMGKLKLTFKSQAAPEGVSQVNDSLLKSY